MNVAADHNQLSIKNEFFIIYDVIHVVQHAVIQRLTLNDEKMKKKRSVKQVMGCMMCVRCTSTLLMKPVAVGINSNLNIYYKFFSFSLQQFTRSTSSCDVGPFKSMRFTGSMFTMCLCASSSSSYTFFERFVATRTVHSQLQTNDNHKLSFTGA